MDTSKSADARALVDLALSTYGRLDIMVNNTAINAPSGNAWDWTDEAWQRTIDVNARIGTQGLSPAYNTSKATVLGPRLPSQHKWQAAVCGSMPSCRA